MQYLFTRTGNSIKITTTTGKLVKQTNAPVWIEERAGYIAICSTTGREFKIRPDQISRINGSIPPNTIDAIISRLMQLYNSANTTAVFRCVSQSGINPMAVSVPSAILGTIIAINTTDTLLYLKIYNTNTIDNIISGVPVMTLPIPAAEGGNGFVLPVSNGIYFDQGICFTITGGAADNDQTAIAAGNVILNLFYQP